MHSYMALLCTYAGLVRANIMGFCVYIYKSILCICITLVCALLHGGIEYQQNKDSCKQVDPVESAPVPAWEPALRMPFECCIAGIIEVTPSSGVINVGNDSLILWGGYG